MQIKININLKDIKINRVIRLFILSDLFLWGGWGMISPIFSIFIVDKIPGATVFTAGMVMAIYWIARALVQMPTAIFLDKNIGEKDDFHTLILALIMAGATALAFPLAKSVWAIYLVAVFYGLSFGLYMPAWSGIFSRHLDKNHYSFDWSLDSTVIGISSAVAAFFGGVLAKVVGFELVFILAAILSFSSAFLFLMVPNLIMPRAQTKPIYADVKDVAKVEIEK